MYNAAAPAVSDTGHPTTQVNISALPTIRWPRKASYENTTNRCRRQAPPRRPIGSGKRSLEHSRWDQCWHKPLCERCVIPYTLPAIERTPDPTSVLGLWYGRVGWWFAVWQKYMSGLVEYLDLFASFRSLDLEIWFHINFFRSSKLKRTWFHYKLW